MLLEQPYKKLVENHFRIDAKTLHSFARSGRVIEIESDANLKFDSSGEQFYVVYTDRNGTYKQPIAFNASKVGYGTRIFVKCPKCERSVNDLYFRSGFACRSCSGLSYTSSMKQRNKLKRHELKIRSLQKNLKMSMAQLMDYPDTKPKYMHRKTYERLLSELLREQTGYVKIRSERIAKFLK